jgi:hypothetical protein
MLTVEVSVEEELDVQIFVLLVVLQIGTLMMGVEQPVNQHVLQTALVVVRTLVKVGVQTAVIQYVQTSVKQDVEQTAVQQQE